MFIKLLYFEKLLHLVKQTRFTQIPISSFFLYRILTFVLYPYCSISGCDICMSLYMNSPSW